MGGGGGIGREIEGLGLVRRRKKEQQNDFLSGPCCSKGG